MASYKRFWRKCHASAQALATARISDDGSTSDSDGLNIEDHNSDRGDLNSDISPQSGNDSNDEQSFSSLDDFIESSELDSDSDASDEFVPDLNEELALWATTHKCTRAAVNDLLRILRAQGLRLPKDSRTLLKTPKVIMADNKCGGRYIYFGIETGILKIAAKHHNFSDNNVLALTINIDGVPLFKSSNAQFWPIIVKISRYEPFIAAIFYGDAKPSPVQEYLFDFCEEFKKLCDSGITIDDKFYPITLHAFVCDAVARAYVKCVKGHTGFYACERCTIRGHTKDNRRVFWAPDSFPARTDEEFQNGDYLDTHQQGRSPLLDYDISCVSRFCLDYMHLVCLGVVKRLLLFLKQGPKDCKLSYAQIADISDQLTQLSGKLPSEFARQPRALFEIDRWKATEFRQFMLYTGPLVLKKVLPRDRYEHFLLLSCAMSILLESHNGKREAYLDYARQLLTLFVDSSRQYYTESFVVYNVHSLLHLPDDAAKFQCSLNDVSSFPFENHLQTIKRKVRNANNPIAQVAKRLQEAERTGRISNLARAPFFMSTKERNCCFLLKDDSFAFIRERRQNGQLLCDVVNMEYLDNFYERPCASKLLNIALIRNFSHARRRLVNRADLYRKVAYLPYGERGHVLCPLLHEGDNL